MRAHRPSRSGVPKYRFSDQAKQDLKETGFAGVRRLLAARTLNAHTYLAEGHFADGVLEACITDELEGPVFLTDYPVAISPLAKKKPLLTASSV